jgi:hypothetical protein
LRAAVKKSDLRLAPVGLDHQGSTGSFGPELVFPANIESERGMVPPGRLISIRNLDLHMINLIYAHNGLPVNRPSFTTDQTSV